MGWDFSTETVRVLTEGLSPLPASAVPSVTFPAALHRSEHFGAVLFLRLWRNGNWDSDTAITARTADGWEPPSSCGGGGWVDPYSRPEHGWDGEPLVIFGTGQQDTADVSGSSRQVTVVEGMASTRVACILCTTPEESFVYAVDSPLGAFVIVVEGEARPTLTALDAGMDAIHPDDE